MKNILRIGIYTAITFLMCACSKEEDNKPTLYGGNEHETYHGSKFHLSGAFVDNTIVWKSDNDYVARVENTGTKHEVTAMFVGETTLRVEGHPQLDVKVKVVPYYTLFKEPYMDWGATPQEMMLKLGHPSRITNGYYIYDPEPYTSIVEHYAYMFKDNALYSSAVFYKYNMAYYVRQAIEERYVVVSREDNEIGFTHCIGHKENPIVDYAGMMQIDNRNGALAVIYMRGSK